MKTSVIYTRVSTDIQDYNRQIEELKSYCKRNDIEIVKEFNEVISGLKKSYERKELQNLINFIQENPIDNVLVYEISRLGRNTSDVLNTIDLLNELKVNLYVLKENINTLNPDKTINQNTQLILTILSTFSRIERDTTIQRSKSGLLHSVKQGNWGGGKFLPFGYKRDGKKLVIDESESIIVKEIYELYLEGLGTQKISNYLNKKGIETKYNKVLTKDITINGIIKHPKEFSWKDGTIYRILTNPLYKGERLYKGIILPSPQIVDSDIFDKVQKRLKGNDSKKGINQKFNYLLDEVEIKCGICGRTYHPHKRKSKKEGIQSRDNRYICLSKRYGKNCENFGIGIDKLNDSIWYFIRRTNDLIKSIDKSMRESSIKTEIEKVRNEILELKNSLSVIERKEGNLIDLLLNDRIDMSIYNNRFDVIRRGKIDIQNNLELTNSKLNELIEFDKKQNNLNEFIKNVKLNPDLLKQHISGIVKKIIIYRVNFDKLKLSHNPQDKKLFIELFLYTTLSPITFIISQRSQLIQMIDESGFDKSDYSIKTGMRELVSHQDRIRYNIKYDELVNN